MHKMPPKRKLPVNKKENVSAAPSKQARMTSFLSPTSAPSTTKPTTPKASIASSPGFGVNELLTDQKWQTELSAEFRKDYFKKITDFLDKQYKSGKQIFPPKQQIFNALNLTPLDQLKVVIIGQDPYHDDGQAHGLCFSVQAGVKPPPSLKNIYKELSTDITGFQTPQHGNLESWAKQGVLLLNATLTVEAHKANSHAGIGWQTFTDAVIKLVSKQCTGVVFILWGGFAQKKEKLIDAKRHTIIKAAHPSPLSATKFYGCKCFSKTNDALKSHGRTPVDWRLPTTVQ